MIRKQTRTSTRAWFFATGFALLVQSLFPSGYMPANMQSGWLAMLCPDGLPVAFVDQLNTRLDGQHNHHHAGHGAAKHDEHSDAGSCQLGSSLDQPLDLYAAETLADYTVGGTPAPLPEQTLLADRRLPQHRSRAPPIS